MRSGSINCLKPVDAAINEAHWYFNALGDGWFDEGWHPVFNDAKGVQAIEMMKATPNIPSRVSPPQRMTNARSPISRTLARWGCNGLRAPRRWTIRTSRGWWARSTGAPPQGHGRNSGEPISVFPRAGFRHAVSHHRHLVRWAPNMRGAHPDHPRTHHCLTKSGNSRQANGFYPRRRSLRHTGLQRRRAKLLRGRRVQSPTAFSRRSPVRCR